MRSTASVLIVALFAVVVESTPAVTMQAPAAGVSLDYGGQTTLTLHEPVIMTVTLSNGSDQRLRGDFGRNFVGAFKLQLTRPDGSIRAADPAVQRTPDEAWVHGTFVLEPFQRYSQSILLNEWLEFSQVGRYSLTIRFRGSILPETDRVTVAPETSIRIDVLPFDERVLRNKCKQLLQVLVDGRTAGDWFAAGKALGAVKHPVAVEYLSLAIKADKQVDSIAIGALFEIGDQTARAALKEETSNRHPETAEYARLALMRLEAKGNK